MAADHTVAVGVDNELHQNARIAARHGGLHWLEIGFVNIDLAELRARLRFGQAHRADLRLREDGCGNVGMIDLDRSFAEHGIGKRVTLADRNRRQVQPVGHVADGVDVGHRCAREAIDGNSAVAWIDRHAGCLQPEIGKVGVPPYRKHHLIGCDAGAARQVRGEFLAVLVHAGDGAAGDDRDAFLFHLGAYMAANVLIEPAQDILAAIDHRHISAEAGKNTGKLKGDVTAPLNHHALRQRVKVEYFVRRDHVLDAGNRDAVIRRASGGDQYISGSYSLPGSKPERMSVLKYRARLDDAGAGFFDIGGICRLQPLNLVVLVGDQGGPIERRSRNGPAEARGILKLVTDVGGVHQQLLGHAATYDAGPAHPVFFGDHHPRAMTGSDTGGAYPARTSSDDEQIDVVFGHAGFP